MVLESFFTYQKRHLELSFASISPMEHQKLNWVQNGYQPKSNKNFFENKNTTECCTGLHE